MHISDLLRHQIQLEAHSPFIQAMIQYYPYPHNSWMMRNIGPHQLREIDYHSAFHSVEALKAQGRQFQQHHPALNLLVLTYLTKDTNLFDLISAFYTPSELAIERNLLIHYCAQSNANEHNGNSDQNMNIDQNANVHVPPVSDAEPVAKRQKMCN